MWYINTVERFGYKNSHSLIICNSMDTLERLIRQRTYAQKDKCDKVLTTKMVEALECTQHRIKKVRGGGYAKLL